MPVNYGGVYIDIMPLTFGGVYTAITPVRYVVVNI
jgi:hypothetical protein